MSDDYTVFDVLVVYLCDTARASFKQHFFPTVSDVHCGPPLLKVKPFYLEMKLLSWCILLLFNVEMIINYI